MDAVSPAVRPDSAASFASYLTLVESYRRSLRSENKSPRTITAYDEAHRLFSAFLAAQGMPQDVPHIRREHVETFLADLHTRYMPATVANRYRALKVFFQWAVEEGEITQSPMRNVRAPHVPEHPPAVLTEPELRRLLRTCRGQRFTDRRDTAILRLFIDTGMRLGELAGLRVTDIDFEANLALVIGKGSRPRLCPFGLRTSRALDRYLRARAKRRTAGTATLWLGHPGPMTDSGVGDVVRRRATQAGIADVHPHRFRHTFAHQWLAQGGNETDLMRLAGWRSRTMLERYGASAADMRARQAHVRFGPGDRI